MQETVEYNFLAKKVRVQYGECAESYRVVIASGRAQRGGVAIQENFYR